jgi:hypothetical protein
MRRNTLCHAARPMACLVRLYADLYRNPRWFWQQHFGSGLRGKPVPSRRGGFWRRMLGG